MEHPENTSDYIRDFLKGRLPEAESAAFRRRMAENPALEEEVAFTRILLSGLEELERQKRQRWRLITGSLLLTAIFALLIYYFFPHNPNEPQDLPPQNERRQVSGQRQPDAVVQGGSASEKFASDRAVSIAWNSQGDVIVGGTFDGAPSFGDFNLPGFGAQDIFLLACNRQLEFRWARQFGSVYGNDYLTRIALDREDNILVTGGLFDEATFGKMKINAYGKADKGEGDAFVAKLNPAGDLLWLRHFGGNMIPHKQTGTNLGKSVAVDRSGNVIATGMYIGTPVTAGAALPAGGPNEDLFLVKYTASGKQQWVKTATCDFNIAANSVAVDSMGNIYLTGYFGHHNYGGSAYFDHITLKSYGGRDVFIAKYSPAGKLLWVRQAGSPNSDGRDYGFSVVADGKGQVVVTGFFEGAARFGDTTIVSRGGRDVFLAKYNSLGDLLWVTSWGGMKNDQSSAVCLDEKDNIYCTGQFTGNAHFDTLQKTSRGDEDVYVVKYNPDGKQIWMRQAGGDAMEWNSDGAHDISIDGNGNLVITGFFSGKMQIGNQTLVSAGREDIFLLFFDRNGNLLEAKRSIYSL